MTEALVLPVTLRETAGKDLNKNRKAGLIPAVLYGHGVPSTFYWVNELAFGKLFRAAGESTLVSLTTGKGAARSVLVHDVTFNPLTNRVSHIDFYQVDMDEELETDIALEFVGEAPAVRELGGIFVKTLETVEVKCLPKDLPHSIIVDISTLVTFDDQIKVSDLVLGSGVVALTEADTVLALVEAPRSEADMAALDTKLDMDVTKVAGVIKEKETAAPAEKKDKK